MKINKRLIAILVGLVASAVFAEEARPFSVINTLRVGQDDNLYRDSDNEEESAYIEDVVELSFLASLSDRTDFTFKSLFNYRSDDEENNFHPNLYAELNHTVSPRLLLKLSDKVRSGNRTTSSQGGKFDYFHNTLSFEPSYVLSSKDSLSAPVSHKIKRNESIIDIEDTEIITAGMTWKRQLAPQRTWAALSLKQAMVEYTDSTRDSENDITYAYAMVSHTFNPQWQGTLSAGGSYNESEFQRGAASEQSDTVTPYVDAGITFAPSSVTRFTANISQMYQESDTSRYAGQTAQRLTLGAQHDFTAKIMGKLTARYQEVAYDSDDDETVAVADADEEYLDLGLRVRFKLDRANSLELGVRHREQMYDDATRDWDQNLIDVGWRVEL